MSELDRYLTLITPVAVLTAIASGIAFAAVTHHLRRDADARLTTYLVVVLGVIWYVPQAAQLALAQNGTPWATLGRMTVFLLGFVVPMWATLRWLQRGRS